MTANQQLEGARQSTATRAGFHFFQLYQCCPRKFYLRHMVGLDTLKVDYSLLFGSAFHAAKARFYETGNIKAGSETGLASVEGSAKLFPTKELYLKALDRVVPLYEAWVTAFGLQDLKRYNIVAVEKELSLVLPGTEFVLTGQVDLIVREKLDRTYWLMDTKTSGTSLDTTLNSLALSDQPTTYLELADKALGIKAKGLIADVAYWHKNAKNEANIECVRGEPIVRTPAQRRDYVEGVAQTFSEISQKAEAVKAGTAPTSVFPRNTYYCTAFFKRCEFADICRKNIAIGQKVKGFKSTDMAPIGATVADSIGEE